MATKLSKTLVPRLEALGLTTKDEESAKKAVLGFLKKNEIEEVDDETLPDLLDMAEAFGTPPAENDEEEEEEEAEEGDDEEEEEEEEAPAPKSKSKKAKLPEPDEDEDLDEAAEEAEAAAPKKKAKPEPAPTSKAKGKKAPVEEEEEDEADEEEEEDETPPPAKKKAGKAPADAPAAKKADKAAPAKKAAVATTSTRGERFDIENKAHKKLLKPLLERFPDGDYDHKMGKDGISVRLTSTDSNNRALFVYNGLRVVDGVLKGMMNFNALRMGGRDAQNVPVGETLVRKTFEDNDDILERLTMEDTLPKVKSATVEEVISMIDQIGEDMETKLKKLDAKLNKNREKLEENMKGAGKAAKDAPATKGKKAPTPVEDEEEEEEETPAPKKKGKAEPAPAPTKAKAKAKKVEDEEDEEEPEAPAPKKKAKK